MASRALGGVSEKAGLPELQGQSYERLKAEEAGLWRTEVCSLALLCALRDPGQLCPSVHMSHVAHLLYRVGTAYLPGLHKEEVKEYM